MNKYPKPKLFKPTIEEQQAAAKELAKLLSPQKAIVLKDGSQVQGTRGKISIERD